MLTTLLLLGLGNYRLKLGLSCLVLFLAGPDVALAWGPEGHAIIAEIAEARLGPQALVEAQALMAPEGHRHLDEIASWADAQHDARPETVPWHFVNVPLDASGYDRARDCADGNCITVQLPRFVAVLANRDATPASRLDALKFVVHFVGDIHQPLHCADHHDRGGNDLHLSYEGRTTNLHAFWDLGMIESALGTNLGAGYTPDLAVTNREASHLGLRVTNAQGQSWAPEGLARRMDQVAVAWTDECHALAVDAYGRLPADRQPGWQHAYFEAEWPVVETQLERAGIRLAEVLNETLR